MQNTKLILRKKPQFYLFKRQITMMLNLFLTESRGSSKECDDFQFDEGK